MPTRTWATNIIVEAMETVDNWYCTCHCKSITNAKSFLFALAFPQLAAAASSNRVRMGDYSPELLRESCNISGHYLRDSPQGIRAPLLRSSKPGYSNEPRSLRFSAPHLCIAFQVGYAQGTQHPSLCSYGNIDPVFQGPIASIFLSTKVSHKATC